METSGDREMDLPSIVEDFASDTDGARELMEELIVRREQGIDLVEAREKFGNMAVDVLESVRYAKVVSIKARGGKKVLQRVHLDRFVIHGYPVKMDKEIQACINEPLDIGIGRGVEAIQEGGGCFVRELKPGAPVFRLRELVSEPTGYVLAVLSKDPLVYTIAYQVADF